MTWKGESRRHSLAKKGISTARGIKIAGVVDTKYPKPKDQYGYPSEAYWHTEFPLKVFRCGDSDERPLVRFYSDEETADSYCETFGGDVSSEIIDIKKPLILNSNLEDSLSRDEIKQLLKKVYVGYEENHEELMKYKKERGQSISEWEDIEEFDLGMRIRGDAWRPLIEYAMANGYDGIITRDTNATLSGSTVSYIVWRE